MEDVASLSRIQEAKRLASLAWPVVLGHLGLMLMGLVDIIVMGRVSRQAIAAVSLGHMFSFSILIVGIGIMRGMDPFFAQAHGAKNDTVASNMLGRALLLTCVLTLPISLLHLVAEPILTLLKQPDSVLPLTQLYCNALIPGVMATLLFGTLTQFLQGQGKMMGPMIVMIVANILNVILNISLVFGVPALGIKAMGVVGCGISTTTVRWICVILLVALSWKTWKAYLPKQWKPIFEWQPMKKVLAHSLPVGFQSGLEFWAFGAMGLMMGMLGEVELAANAVALNVISFSFMIPFGIGAAAATRVGHLVGANQPWKETARLTIIFAVCFMMLSACTLLTFGNQIAGLFTTDTQVIALVVALFPVAAGFQLFDGIQVAAFGVLRGAGDTKIPSLANMVGYWLIGLPLGFIFGVYLYQNPLAVWGGIAIALCLISMLLLLRIRYILKRGALVVVEAT